MGIDVIRGELVQDMGTMEFERGMARLLAGNIALRGENGEFLPNPGDDDDPDNGSFARLYPDQSPPGSGGVNFDEIVDFLQRESEKVAA